MPFLSIDTIVWVAYSGGLDSHVLLHLLTELRATQAFKLKAVYVNHGLSKNAKAWGEHCRQVCHDLKVDFVAVSVDATADVGESPEASARRARYQAIMELLHAGDYLCTAHHQDDQAETLLLQLIRGAGPKGLAAMPVTSNFGEATQVRPLLNVSRAMIQAYAEQHALQWVDDESNADTGYDRNYLRHEILPRLRRRWPSVTETLSRSATHCAEAAELMSVLAQQDYQQISAASLPELSIAKLLRLDEARLRNVLRYWFGLSGLPLPSDKKLQHVIHDVLHVAGDKTPFVQWPGAEVRRFRDSLYAMPPLPEFDASRVVHWPDLNQPLTLSDGRCLYCETTNEKRGLDLDRFAGGDVTVRFRQGGETLRPAGSSQHKSLKNIFQEQSMPTWLRSRVPLIYIGDELHVVVGVCNSDAITSDTSSYQLRLG